MTPKPQLPAFHFQITTNLNKTFGSTFTPYTLTSPSQKKFVTVKKNPIMSFSQKKPLLNSNLKDVAKQKRCTRVTPPGAKKISTKTWIRDPGQQQQQILARCGHLPAGRWDGWLEGRNNWVMEDLTSAVTMLGLVCWPGSQDQLTYSSSNVRAQPHLRAWAHTKAQLCPQAGANSRAHKHKPKPTPRLNFNMVPITVQISHVLATKEHVNVQYS